MKVSYKNLQHYFDATLPSPELLEDALTFHSWEVEGLEHTHDDVVFDIKVLPDKSAWALSHRGIAKDISTILDIKMVRDPLAEIAVLSPVTNDVRVTVETPTCSRYTAVLIQGVHVGPSPKWLQDFLHSLGQRSINSIVDFTNYVMFSIGQPLHAFDAQKLSHAHGYAIVVRNAHEGERIVTLTGEECTLSSEDALIVDGGTDTPLGIAGIKGGRVASVDEGTVDILLESAHFNPIAIRKSSARLKLRTDASLRFENNISSEMAGYGAILGASHIQKFCGGTIVGYVDTNPEPLVQSTVSVSLEKINAVLGLSLTMKDVEEILVRFGYVYSLRDTTITVTPPFERSDLVIQEDLIDEIGRVYGYEHIASVVPDTVPLAEYNARHYYSEKLRDILIGEGFSEVITSSFKKKDMIELQNALASDKRYLRSSLRGNMREVLDRNIPNVDLLALSDIRVFEIGTVFKKTDDGRGVREYTAFACGVRTKQGGYVPKDDVLLREIVTNIEGVLGQGLTGTIENGVYECDLTTVIEALPTPTAYEPYVARDITFSPYSSYPFISRDIAVWVSESVPSSDVLARIRATGGDLLTRVTLFDEFAKDGKVSYAFRLIFQSYDRTLTDEEVGECMVRVNEALTKASFEVR